MKKVRLMYPSECFNKLCVAISRPVKITFISTIIMGLVIHFFFLANMFPNLDTVTIYANLRWLVITGRWFAFVPGLLSGDYAMPWVNGLLSIFYIAISACLIVKCLRINKALHCVLISGLMISFPSFTNSLVYIFYSDALLSAMVFACLAVYLTHRFRYGFCLGIIFIALSLGVYQSYLSFAAGLSVAVIIVDIIQQNSSIKKILIKGGKLFITLLLGVIIYFPIFRFALKKSELLITGYQGIDQIGRMPISTFLLLIRQSYMSIVKFFYNDNYGLHGSFLSYAFLVIFFIALILFSIIIIQKRLKNNLPLFFVLCSLIILYPLSCNLVYIMASNSFVYLNMVYGLVLLPIAVITLMELAQNYLTSEIRRGIRFAIQAFCWIISIIIGICIYHYGILANKVYTKAHIVYEQTFAYTVELVTRIQNTEGYTIDKPIIFIGTPGETINQIKIFKELHGFLGVNDNIAATYSYPMFIENFLGFRKGIEFGNPSHIAQYQLEQILDDMPLYPEVGSIRMVNDAIIVKFTTHAGNLAYMSELPILKDIDILAQNTFDISSIEIINGNLILYCGIMDPQLYIAFDPPLSYSGNWGFIELTYTNTEPGFLQIYYDYGYGLHEELSTGLNFIQTEYEQTKIVLPIVHFGGIHNLIGIRIDPPDGTVFTVKSIKFLAEF